MSNDTVTYTVPDPKWTHDKVRVPTGFGISQHPDGSQTVTQSGFRDECYLCRISWPCMPAQLAAARERIAALELERDDLLDERTVVAKVLGDALMLMHKYGHDGEQDVCPENTCRIGRQFQQALAAAVESQE